MRRTAILAAATRHNWPLLLFEFLLQCGQHFKISFCFVVTQYYVIFISSVQTTKLWQLSGYFSSSFSFLQTKTNDQIPFSIQQINIDCIHSLRWKTHILLQLFVVVCLLTSWIVIRTFSSITLSLVVFLSTNLCREQTDRQKIADWSRKKKKHFREMLKLL